MKLKKCPECGESLYSDCWVTGRKLQQRCECGWKGEPRTPETIPVKNTKTVHVGQFSGYNYEIFDKYGQYAVISRSYYSKEEAIKELMDDLKQHNKIPNYAPCTAVLYPPTVEVKGEIFK